MKHRYKRMTSFLPALLIAICALALSGCMVEQHGFNPAQPSGFSEDASSEADDINREVPAALVIPDGRTDVSLVQIGMPYLDVIKTLPEDSFSLAFGSGIYVNDETTGHVFNVKFDFKGQMPVTDVTDTGIDIDFIAPADSLEKLSAGMTFDQIVQILGRPLYCPTSGVASMLWHVGDPETTVLLSFSDGEAMIFDGNYN